MSLQQVVPSPKHPRQAETTPQVRHKVCAGFSSQHVTHGDAPLYICNPQKPKRPLIFPARHKKCHAPSLVRYRAVVTEESHNISLTAPGSLEDVWTAHVQ